MIKTGLLSVTFRELKIQKIVKLCISAGLESIEWGGDIHVPHGDLITAKQVGEITRDKGLQCSAYGSYYRLGEIKSPAIETVLDTAETLGTSIVRVWAGQKASSQASAAYRQAVLDDAMHVVELAKKRSMTISLEYHSHTLTDTLESTLNLLESVNSPHFTTFWQPPHTSDLKSKVHSLKSLLPWLTNVHVFHWHPQTLERFKLAKGASDWQNYLDIMTKSARNHTLSLEFVRGDDPNRFMADAQTLKSWLENFQQQNEATK